MTDEFPEHEKLKFANLPQKPGQTIKDFLDWCEENGLELCKRHAEGWYPTGTNHHTIIAISWR